MVKLKNPLLSFDARNTLSKAITFVKRRGQNIAEKKPEVKDVKSLAQLSWRHMYLKAVALWHALSAAEKQEWESLARPKHMTGFAWFMSQCLRPNPGIYLPLQGGTMSGDIDMAKNRLLKLPLPTDSQEPLTLAWYNSNIAPWLWNQYARAFNDADIPIPDATYTYLPMNSESDDTDSIHDLVINNSRLTCRTAGLYLIGASIHFDANAVGGRNVMIRLNRTWDLATVVLGLDTDGHWRSPLSTLWKLNVDDYVEIRTYQNSGAPLNILFSPAHSPILWMVKVGK